MSKPKTDYSELEDIREDLDSLKVNVVELTKHIKKNGQQHTQDLKNVLHDRLETLQTSGREQYKNMEKHVKTKPVQSMAAAFVAGLAISMLMKRS